MNPREQALDALARANQVRAARAAWKRRIRELARPEAMRAAVAIVTDPPEWALTWQVAEVLRTLPRIGATKVRQQMNRWGMRETICLGSLTDRQRRLVIKWALQRLERVAA